MGVKDAGGDSQKLISCVREYRTQLQKLDSEANVAALKSLTDDVIHCKQKYFAGLQESLPSCRSS